MTTGDIKKFKLFNETLNKIINDYYNIYFNNPGEQFCYWYFSNDNENEIIIFYSYFDSDNNFLQDDHIVSLDDIVKFANAQL